MYRFWIYLMLKLMCEKRYKLWFLKIMAKTGREYLQNACGYRQHLTYARNRCCLVYQTQAAICANVALHAKVPSLAFVALVHLRVTFAAT